MPLRIRNGPMSLYAPAVFHDAIKQNTTKEQIGSNSFVKCTAAQLLENVKLAKHILSTAAGVCIHHIEPENGNTLITMLRKILTKRTHALALWLSPYSRAEVTFLRQFSIVTLKNLVLPHVECLFVEHDIFAYIEQRDYLVPAVMRHFIDPYETRPEYRTSWLKHDICVVSERMYGNFGRCSANVRILQFIKGGAEQALQTRCTEFAKTCISPQEWFPSAIDFSSQRQGWPALAPIFMIQVHDVQNDLVEQNAKDVQLVFAKCPRVMFIAKFQVVFAYVSRFVARVSWQRCSIVLAFRRANRNHIFCDSVLPVIHQDQLLPSIIDFIGDEDLWPETIPLPQTLVKPSQWVQSSVCTSLM